MILDTSFLVDLGRRDKGAIALLDRLEAGSETLGVPAPVFYELWEGVERSKDPVRELERLARLLDAYDPLPLTPAAARRAGKISGSLARRGAAVDDVDLLIAGIALEEGRSVVTRNVRDFERVEGLRIVGY